MSLAYVWFSLVCLVCMRSQFKNGTVDPLVICIQCLACGVFIIFLSRVLDINNLSITVAEQVVKKKQP